MASPANIVLTDGTTNHTFVPLSREGTLYKGIAREAVTYAGHPQLALSASFADKNRPDTHKVRSSIAWPIEALVDGVTVVVRTYRRNVDYVLPASGTDAERLKFSSMCEAFDANALARGYVRTLDCVL